MDLLGLAKPPCAKLWHTSSAFTLEVCQLATYRMASYAAACSLSILPMCFRYAQGQLIEVNAHSLFSKWFSESGKLVSRLFAKIQV